MGECRHGMGECEFGGVGVGVRWVGSVGQSGCEMDWVELGEAVDGCGFECG